MAEHRVRIDKPQPSWKWRAQCTCGWGALSWSWSREYDFAYSGQTLEQWIEDNGGEPGGGALPMTLEHLLDSTAPTGNGEGRRHYKGPNVSDGVVRLSVNVATDVAVVLRSAASSQGVSVTEAVRRMVVLWKLVTDAQDQGHRVVVLTRHGRQREVVL